jgi:heme-degrading monooxygenase HmoA
MILEVADIRIDPARAPEFEVAIAHGVQTAIAPSKGYRSHQIQRSAESPGRYLLMIQWETLEDHTVGFRGGPAFAQWRAIVSPFFASPPVVEHFTLVASS